MACGGGELRKRIVKDTARLPLAVLLRVGQLVEPMGLARHDEMKRRGTSCGALPDGVKQRGRRGGLVRDDEDVGRLCHE